MLTRFATATATIAAAICGPALAQSNVEIYGIIDLGLSRTNSGTSAGALPGAGTLDVTQMRAGQSSRLGFRGREDLGDGLYARFLLEHRLNADTGAATSTLFWAGETIVALGGRFGEVYAGRTYSPAYRVAGVGDPFGYNYSGQLGSRYTLAGHQTVASSIEASNIRYANALGFKSASFAGFGVEAQVAPGEGARKRATGLNLTYASGRLYAGLGYDALDSSNRVVVGVVKYEVGAFAPSLTYANNKGGVNGSAKSYGLGLTANVGTGVVLATWGKYDSRVDANDSTMMSLGYRHLLSKRTSLYVTGASGKRDARSRVNTWDTGINHRF